MIKTVILDDDPNAIKAIQASLISFPQIEIVATAYDSSQLFNILKEKSVDLVFLDIEVKEEHGFIIAETLKQQFPQVAYIFLTGYASYAIDGYDFNPAGFLTKPINKLKLQKVIERFEQSLTQKVDTVGNPKLMFETKKGTLMVSVVDIIYIERRNRKNYLITTTEEIAIVNYTIRELAEMLEPYHFYLCHQSYIVPLKRIQSIKEEGRQLYYLEVLGTSQRIPLSRNKYQECKNKISLFAARKL